MNKFVITIDGPAASGKEKIAQYISKKWKYKHLDSGILYRRLASIILDNNVNVDEIDELKKIIKGCKSIGSTYLTIDSCNTTGLENIIHKSKKLINITDISGRKIINFKKNTPLFYFFDDGTFEKVIRLE